MSEIQVRPFDFSKLPKLSIRQLMITQNLLQRFPQFSDAGAIAPAFLEPLSRDLGLSLRLRFAGFSESSLSDFMASLPSPCVAVLLKLMPTEQRMVLEVDYFLARILIDRLLGGAGEFPQELTPFSPIEEGVFEFLILKVLSQLKEIPGRESVASLRVMKVLHESKLLADPSVSVGEMGCVMKFFLGISEERGGYVHIYFPHPLVEGLFLGEDELPAEEEDLQKGVERVGHIKTSLAAEVGRVNLLASELAQLEKNDVILFDESLAGMGSHGVTGKAVLRVGESSSDGFLAELIDSEGKVVVKILDFYGGQ